MLQYTPWLVVQFLGASSHGRKKSEDYKPYQAEPLDMNDSLLAVLNSSLIFGGGIRCLKAIIVVGTRFFPRKSKAMIDQIDATLASHFGFTEEELDLIINYDIKYRMGL